MPSQFPSNNVEGDLKVTGKVTAGSGAVEIIDGTGKIPALSSTYLASLNGSTLTGVNSNNAPGDLTVAGSVTAGSGAVEIINGAGKIPALSSTYLANLDGSALTGLSSVWTLVGRTAASSGSVSVAVSPTVSRLLCVWNGLQTDTDDNGFQLRVSSSGSEVTSGYHSINYGAYTGGTELIFGSSDSHTGVDGCLYGTTNNGLGNAVGEQSSGFVWIVVLEAHSAPVVHWFNGAAVYKNALGTFIHVTIGGEIDLAGAIDGVLLVPESGNLDGGEMALYQVAVS